MATIKPFCAIRPTIDKVHLVASRSYISYNKRALEAKLSSNPYSFIHIINPEFGKEKTAKPNSKELFLKVKERFNEFVEEGIFKKDESPNFYVYEQIKNGKSITGIIALASAIDYGKGFIKKHEQTLSKRESLFCEYLKVCDIHAEPVLLSYPDHDWLNGFMKTIKTLRPEYDFSTSNKVRHRLWLVDKNEDIQNIETSFEDVAALYIADGHHRSASAYLLSQQSNFKENHPYNYFLSYLVPESDLQIFEYNRVVKDLNGLSKDAFLDKVGQHFIIEKSTKKLEPKEKGELSLYVDNQWFILNRKRKGEELDADILNKFILNPVLNIVDLRNDKRVGFIGGENASQKMQEAVDSKKFKAAFGLFPVSIEDLKKVADNDQIMPPKSTYIEPKLRSGLTIYSYSS